MEAPWRRRAADLRLNGPSDHADRLLLALIDWVEEGKAPGAVVMHRGAERAQYIFRTSASESGVVIQAPTGVARDFLVCRFPMVSVFDRSKAKVPGAVYEAANWSCKATRS